MNWKSYLGAAAGRWVTGSILGLRLSGALTIPAVAADGGGAGVGFVPLTLGGGEVRATEVKAVGANGVDVSARGGDIFGAADSAGMAAQNLSGNFDLRVRVESLTITDPYATAGLVVRSSEDANATFAGAFAGSPSVGVFFRSRSGSGASAPMTAPRGGYPVNHPRTWLRMRRSGSELTGFGSMDGTNWTILGASTISMPDSVTVGLAVSGRDTNAVALDRKSVV